VAELDKALVSIGIKGQDVVLSTLDRVQKKKNSLTSDTGKISLRTQSKASRPSKQEKDSLQGGKTSGGIPDVEKSAKSFKTLTKDLNEGDKKLKQFSKDIKAGSKEQKDSLKTEKEKKESALSRASKTAVGGASEIGQGVAGMDSGAVVSGVTSMLAKAGAVGMAVGAAAKIVTMGAKAGPEFAKASSKEAYGLSTRNSATSYYGGDIRSKGQGLLSNNEMAQLVATVSGSFGKLQKPMTDVLSKYITSGKKDTGALARVSAGDWRSTGTDKGFFLQKLADSFGDLPPSIAQKFQARLLEQNGGEIQNATAAQQTTQGTTSGFENREEKQAMDLYKIALQSMQTMRDLNERNMADQRTLAAASVMLGKGIEATMEGLDYLDDKLVKAGNAVINFANKLMIPSTRGK
jgi:hypothetical protein